MAYRGRDNDSVKYCVKRAYATLLMVTYDDIIKPYSAVAEATTRVGRRLSIS